MPSGREFLGNENSRNSPSSESQASFPARRSENQTPPAKLSITMSAGPLFGVGMAYSVIRPEAVILPILLVLDSVKYMTAWFATMPATIDVGPLSGVGMTYSVTTPLESMRPILLARYSVNQRSVLPDVAPGPGAMPSGPALNVGIGNSTIGVAEVTSRRPIRLPSYSVNQMKLEVELVIPRGLLEGVGMSYSVTSPSPSIKPIRLVPTSVKTMLPPRTSPRAIASGRLPGATGRSVIDPSGFTRASESAFRLSEPDLAEADAVHLNGSRGVRRQKQMHNGVRTRRERPRDDEKPEGPGRKRPHEGPLSNSYAIRA